MQVPKVLTGSVNALYSILRLMRVKHSRACRFNTDAMCYCMVSDAEMEFCALCLNPWQYYQYISS